MTFASTATAITQTGTDTDLSGMSGLTGVTTTTVGAVTVYTIASRQLVINGTCTMDPLTEMVLVTSTSVANSLEIGSAGTFNVGAAITSSYGTGDPAILPEATALVLSKDGPGCCADGSIEVNGTLNLYGAIIRVQGVVVWNAGCSITIRNGFIYSEPNVTGGTAPTQNCRIRVLEGTNIDIDGFTTYGLQFDDIITTDEAITKVINYRALNKPIPIENAGYQDHAGIWRQMPDNTSSADAMMNNWQGLHDVKVTLLERGSRMMIVPDSVSASYSHGGREYHEYTVTCKDTDGSAIQSVETYLKDVNNGARVTTTTPNPDINGSADQVIQAATAASGSTSLQTLMIAFWYRTNTVSDLTAPDGQERCDYRGKNHAINAAVTSASGTSATITSSDSSLPLLYEDDWFILEDSTSNDLQIWEATADGSVSSVAANRLNGNATNETENAMQMVILGEDFYDINLWSYLHLPYKFVNAQMNGINATDFEAVLLDDVSITQTDRTTVQSYSFLNTLDMLYDRAKDYKCLQANVTKPDIDTPIASGSGDLVDLGDIALVVDGDSTTAFAYTSGTPNTVTVSSNGVLQPTLISNTEQINSSLSTSLVIAWPSQTIMDADDVAYLIVGCAEADSNAFSTPTGFTVVTGLTEVQTGGSPTSTPGVSVFRKVIVGTETGNITVSGSYSTGMAAQLLVFRNVDTTNPESVASTTATGSTGLTDPASITSSHDNSLIVTIGFADDGDQTLVGGPSGYTAIDTTATLLGAGTGE